MIKFFRRIRQKLINEGNLKRYLIYAIGEIILVMIGILLALQVNHWNQNNIATKTEKEVLERMLLDLKGDVNRIDILDSLYSNQAKIHDEFSNFLRKDKYIETDFETFVNFWGADYLELNPRTATYEEMVNTGKIYDIENELLVNEITEYYISLRQTMNSIEQEELEYKRYWSSAELVDFWHSKNLSFTDTEESKINVFTILNGKNNDTYKHLLNMTYWGGGMTRNNIHKLIQLKLKNTDLQTSVLEYFD